MSVENKAHQVFTVRNGAHLFIYAEVNSPRVAVRNAVRSRSLIEDARASTKIFRAINIRGS